MANEYKINAAGGLRIPVLSSDPSSPADGSIWYNSTSGTIKKRENGVTTEVSGGTEFDDATFKIVDSDGDGFGMLFDVSASTADRTLTMPDTNVDLGDLAGKVAGPASATDNAVVRYDATTGKLVQDSGVLIDDSNNMTGVNDLTVTGNLTVNGTTTTVSTNDLVVEDNNILLRDGAADATGSTGSGISIERGSTGADASLVWDETNQRFKMGLAGAEIDIVDVSSSQTLTNKSISAGQIDSGTFADARIAQSNVTQHEAALSITESQISDLGAYIENVVEDTTPQLGGTLDLNSQVVSHGSGSFQLGESASNFMQMEYVHATTLTAGTTAVAADFTLDTTTYDGAIIEFKMKQASTGDVRVGTLYISSDGSAGDVVESASEVGDPDITWSAAMNGTDLEISYTNADGTNDVTMRSLVKRLKA